MGSISHTKHGREWLRVQAEVRASDFAVPKPPFETRCWVEPEKVVPTATPTPVVYSTDAGIGAAGSGGAATAAPAPTREPSKWLNSLWVGKTFLGAMTMENEIPPTALVPAVVPPPQVPMRA